MKRIIALLLAILMCAAFVGCGDESKATPDEKGNVGTADEAAKPAETSPETLTKNGKPYASVQDYISDPEVKESIDSAKDSNSEIVTFDYYADGNQLVYDYTYTQQYDEERVAEMKKSLDETLEKNSSYYMQVVDQLRKNVDVENPQLVMNYRNSDGTIIATRTFG